MECLFAVLDGNGALIRSAESVNDGELGIAREFGIPWGELSRCQARQRNSKSLIAYACNDGRFREIISASAGD